MRTLIASVVALMLPAWALAQPMASLPPVLKQVSNVDKDKGHIVLAETVIKLVPVTVERVVTVNGQQVTETVTEYTRALEVREVVYDLGRDRIIGRDGKAVPLGDAWKRLNKGSVIAVSGNSNAPADAFLRALSPDTLIVIPGELVGPKKD